MLFGQSWNSLFKQHLEVPWWTHIKMLIQRRLCHIRWHIFFRQYYTAMVHRILPSHCMRVEVLCKPLPLRIFTLEANVVTYTTLFSTNKRALDCVRFWEICFKADGGDSHARIHKVIATQAQFLQFRIVSTNFKHLSSENRWKCMERADGTPVENPRCSFKVLSLQELTTYLGFGASTCSMVSQVQYLDWWRLSFQRCDGAGVVVIIWCYSIYFCIRS